MYIINNLTITTFLYGTVILLTVDIIMIILSIVSELVLVSIAFTVSEFQLHNLCFEGFMVFFILQVRWQ